MSRFHSLIVKEVTRETADCVSISFQIPAELSSDFKYFQGQYITFKLIVNGQEIRRSYSVCSSPLTDSDLRVAVKKVKDGRGSIFLNEHVKSGDVLEVMPPMGNFYTAMNASNNKEYILFAGGSGITPMLSIIKTVLKAEPNSKIQLFYGNENESSIIFMKQLNTLEQESLGKLKVHYIINQSDANTPEIYRGIMTQEKVLSLMKSFVQITSDSEIFICGPTPMMQNVEQALISLNVPKPQVHLEYFTAPVEANTNEPIVGAKKASLTIILDGDEVVTELLPDESILEAALRINLDAPYACQGGSCCTCRALLTEGKVDMKVNYALLDAEVKQGFILTCQSYALTDNVVVDYDKGR
ncbi:MAG TPA: FAD-binding oxidoreductase [Bacteroidia bacterium]|nr:FAD-binding oxidoreductase [Bacteroidia bacterium]